MKRLLIASALFCQVMSAMATVTDIAQVPVTQSSVVEPNVIMGLDDSGSMDWEILVNTNDGALWWDNNADAYLDSNNNLLAGSYSTGNWAEYGYLFPNGTASDARIYGDSPTPRVALPPIPQFAFVRCSTYNPIYYNPSYTYKPWTPAYYNGATNSFSNASSTAARSHPIFPTSGSPTTTNLTVTNFSEATNYTFQMQGGMVIPGATISGIYYRVSGSNNTWQHATTNLTIPTTLTYDVAIPYFPASYYVVDSTCTSGASCATAPDGTALRQYLIQPGNTYPSGRTYAAELQNFANWFTYYRKRKLHVASAMSYVLPALQGIRGGIVDFNYLSPVTMYDFNSTSSSSNEQVLLGMIYQNAANGGTPTRETLSYIGQQYMTNQSIVQYGCQNNAALILTDGYALASSVYPPAYSSATYGGSPPYTTLYTPSLADLALAYYTLNIRPDLPTGLIVNDSGNSSNPNFDANPNLHLNTYAISLTTNGLIYGTGVPAALNPFTTFPNYPIPDIDHDISAVDDLWHATINGRGQIFEAPDIVNLTQQVLNIFTNVLIQSGAGSAVGILQSYITSTNNLALVTSYIGASGDLQEVLVNPATGGILANSTQWSAQALIDAMTPTSRIIATYNGVAGIPFEWANLTFIQQLELNLLGFDGQLVLNWLRGDRTNEGITYRIREHVLGDIVDAEPVVVSGAVGSYSDTGYATFSNTIASRPTVIYQGANDGFLHAFDKITGQERWAYAPNLVFSNLNQLPNVNYVHQFYVDGTPSVGDVYVNSAWKTILVGGLRAGGNGYYALNVTSPTSIGTEANLASTVLWEFPNSSTPNATKNNVGLSFGKPVIVKTTAAGWVVLVTSGYNNTAGDGHGHLFVLNPATGAVIADLNTGQGSAASPAGLAQIAAYAPNAQTSALASQVYGGDLLGNVWRFDLSDPSSSNWNVKLLAQLVDNSGRAQPVTTEPEIGVYNNQRFIFVGTGQLLGLSDVSNTYQQSMYALVDNLSSNPTITPLRSNLAPRTVIGGNTVTGIAYSAQTQRGWYIDFPGSGERENVNSVLAFGTLVFNTNMPSPAACSAQSFQYAVSLSNGLPLPAAAFGSITPWSRRVIGNTLVSKPTVVVLSNGTVVSLNHKSDSSIDNAVVPQTSSQSISKVAWREILTQ